MGSPGATGHASMLSSPVMARAPNFSLNPLKRLGRPPDEEWEVPVAELEVLLEASQRLGLDERDITPVQVWACVNGREGFEVEQLEVLKELLLPMVKCVG